uniref:Uncharacterized protein n=1 Tax=Trieres chinensis TaxID=1514140 RepID=A0A7S2EG30_TRICV|eukprot:CAMPEP_0183308394 /NCGR_PEP_ID=MMETSP0160_2-20130417/21767_1 /TAXON_ID=2839 ORGANISM="Odontella Sinensis, Strain Grunow 1884" /NCGR_SAMPLE_ID=MMETSP0160_2 /ASSEMBLY_ACC=CAM_ASM_000250 /LENGTH=315 /DNA_ID=CAMNT_0025472235 /DNA_START=63 /DNA_END=1010 /DNA_ORIENTATION=+
MLLGAHISLGQQIWPNRVRHFRTNTSHPRANRDPPVGHFNANNVEESLDQEFARLLNNYDMSMSMNFGADRCLPDDADEFKIDGDQDIGDVLYDHGGRARGCRQKGSCYRIEDNGDDPDYDPEAGDTMRFAYKIIESTSFSFESKVCSKDDDKSCDPSTWQAFGRCGRIGLNIRESLDPWAKNVFVFFEPFYEVGMIYRKTNEEIPYKHLFDGSPDSDSCFWVSIVREGDTFTFDYFYAKGGSLDQYTKIKKCEKGPSVEPDFSRSVTIEDMPEQVYVGLGVSTPVSDPDLNDPNAEWYRRFTKAKFEHILLDTK